MSRSYLSGRQVQFERDSLNYIEKKHKNLVEHCAKVHQVWSHENCNVCQSIRRLINDDVAWSNRDLERRRRKVERLERERSRKRRIKRATRRQRREASALTR